MRSENPTQEFIGLVLDYDLETGIAIVEQRNYFEPGDEVEVFSPRFETLKFRVEDITDEEGNQLEAARHPKQHLQLFIPFPVEAYDMLRKIKS
jgi:putative protease